MSAAAGGARTAPRPPPGALAPGRRRAAPGADRLGRHRRRAPRHRPGAGGRGQERWPERRRWSGSTPSTSCAPARRSGRSTGPTSRSPPGSTTSSTTASTATAGSPGPRSGSPRCGPGCCCGRCSSGMQPDLVLSTYPIGSGGLAWLRRRGRLPVPVGAWVSDFAPHPFWVHEPLDLHVVMHPRDDRAGHPGRARRPGHRPGRAAGGAGLRRRRQAGGPPRARARRGPVHRARLLRGLRLRRGRGGRRRPARRGRGPGAGRRRHRAQRGAAPPAGPPGRLPGGWRCSAGPTGCPSTPAPRTSSSPTPVAPPRWRRWPATGRCSCSGRSPGTASPTPGPWPRPASRSCARTAPRSPPRCAGCSTTPATGRGSRRPPPGCTTGGSVADDLGRLWSGGADEAPEDDGPLPLTAEDAFWAHLDRAQRAAEGRRGGADPPWRDAGRRRGRCTTRWPPRCPCGPGSPGGWSTRGCAGRAGLRRDPPRPAAGAADRGLGDGDADAGLRRVRGPPAAAGGPGVGGRRSPRTGRAG